MKGLLAKGLLFFLVYNVSVHNDNLGTDKIYRSLDPKHIYKNTGFIGSKVGLFSPTPKANQDPQTPPLSDGACGVSEPAWSSSPSSSSFQSNRLCHAWGHYLGHSQLRRWSHHSHHQEDHQQRNIHI